MSHNLERVNSDSFDRQSQITLQSSTSLAFQWFGTTSYSFGLETYPNGITSGYNLPFYKNTNYVQYYVGQSVSIVSSSYSIILPQYQSGWFDQITLPGGEYNLIYQYAQTDLNEGTICWVNNSNSNRIAPVITTESQYNNLNNNVFFSAPSSGLSIGLRVLSGAGNGASFDSILNSFITILKVG